MNRGAFAQTILGSSNYPCNNLGLNFFLRLLVSAFRGKNTEKSPTFHLMESETACSALGEPGLPAVAL